MIYLPERTFNFDEFLSSVEKTYSKFGRAVVAVSEGVQMTDGMPVCGWPGETNRDRLAREYPAFGSTSLGDTLMDLVKDKLKIKRVPSDTFGSLSEYFSGCVSEVDANEAREVGERAVRIAAWHRVDGSITIERMGDYSVRYNVTPLDQVAKDTKSMPDSFIEGVNST